MESPDHEKRSIVEYVELESGDKVSHAEKVSSEIVLGDKTDVWDVYTKKDRWWVITSPTNLYDQKEFKSMDYALSFHAGLRVRMSSRGHSKAPEDKVIGGLESVWRIWEQAAEDLDRIEEIEDCQSIGVKCRSALVQLVKNISDVSMVPTGETMPKKADFVNWSKLIAKDLCKGSNRARLRSYLKEISQSCWELVGWLTHSESATKVEADFVLKATENILFCYSHLLLEKRTKPPDKCPKCGSYRIYLDYRSKKNKYFSLCEACGWEKEGKSS